MLSALALAGISMISVPFASPTIVLPAANETVLVTVYPEGIEMFLSVTVGITGLFISVRLKTNSPPPSSLLRIPSLSLSKSKLSTTPSESVSFGQFPIKIACEVKFSVFSPQLYTPRSSYQPTCSGLIELEFVPVVIFCH